MAPAGVAATTVQAAVAQAGCVLQQGKDQGDHSGQPGNQQAGGEQHGNAAGHPARGHGTEPVAQHAPGNSTDHRHGDKQKDAQLHPVKAASVFVCFPAWFGQGLAADQPHDAREAGIDAASIVALFEARRDRLVNDAFGGQVGDCAFERFGHLDAQPAVLHRDNQQQAVTNVLAANFPAVRYAVGVTCNVFGLGAGHQQDHHLRAARLFEGA